MDSASRTAELRVLRVLVVLTPLFRISNSLRTCYYYCYLCNDLSSCGVLLDKHTLFIKGACPMCEGPLACIWFPGGLCAFAKVLCRPHGIILHSVKSHLFLLGLKLNCYGFLDSLSKFLISYLEGSFGFSLSCPSDSPMLLCASLSHMLEAILRWKLLAL